MRATSPPPHPRHTTLLLLLLLCLLSSPLTAQETRQFDQLQVREMSAEELTSAPDLEDPSKILTVSPDTRIAQLEEEDKLAILQRAHANTVIITALHMPPEPFEQVPTISRGHGVWLKLDEDAAPLLLSSIDWLKDAREIYVEPFDAGAQKGSSSRKKRSKTSPHTTSARMPGVEMNHSLEALTVGKASLRAFNKEKKDLVEVEPLHADRMLGLIALSPRKSSDAKKLAASTGLTLIEEKYAGASLLFGFTPVHPDQLSPTSLLPTRPTDESLSFYFQTTYPPIFGAPVLDEKGRLVTLNALRHPQQPERSLAVPPGAIRRFMLGALQARK